VLLLLSGCGKKEQAEPEIRPVRATTVLSGASRESATYTAEIRARYETDLSFQLGGKLVQRAVDVGATVKKGAVLARLDENDQRLALDAARSAANGARAELERARTEEARLRDLLERGLTTQANFLSAQTAVKTAQSRLEQATAEESLQQQRLGYTTLRANQDGVITRAYEEAGAVVAAGQRIVSLAQPSELEAAFDVSENRVEELRDNPTVQITMLTGQGRSFTGRIREVSPSADPVSRTYAVRASILEPPPLLRLGMTATVTLPRFGSSPMISIPTTALFQAEKGHAVWVVKPDLTLELRPVTVARYETERVLLTSGLANGDRVVTAGVHKLSAGQKVRLLGEPVASAGEPSGGDKATGAEKPPSAEKPK
jgi:RND family efflux transporter MFP subunit